MQYYMSITKKDSIATTTLCVSRLHWVMKHEMTKKTMHKQCVTFGFVNISTNMQNNVYLLLQKMDPMIRTKCLRWKCWR